MAESTLTSYFDTNNVFKLLIGAAETVISEPFGYTDDTFKLTRNTLEHGVNWEYSASEVALKFDDDAGRQEILTEYNINGIDSQIYLLVGEDTGGGFVEFSRMQLVMKYFKRKKDFVECTLKRVRFQDKFRARKNIEVDITRNTSLDGNSITPIAGIDVVLHSKTIKRNLIIDHNTGSDYTLNPSGAFLPTSGGSTQLWSSGFINFGRSHILANEFDDALQSRNTLVFGGGDAAVFRGKIPSNDTQEWLKPFFVCKEKGTYTISYNLDLADSLIKFPYKHPPNYFSKPRYLERVIKFAVEVVRSETISNNTLNRERFEPGDYEVIHEDYAYKNDLEDNKLVNWESLARVTVNNVEQVIMFTGATSTMTETKIELDVGDTINLHMSYHFNEVPDAFFEEQNMNITDDSYFKVSPESFFKIEADTIFPPTKAKMYKVSDVMKQLALIYTGTTDSLLTDFFTTGQGAKWYTTTGKLIRGFSESESPPFYSFKKLYDSCNAIFCTGIGFEEDVSNNDIVRVEGIEYFYNDSEILDLGDTGEYEESVFEEGVYNEIEVGYRKITVGSVEEGIGLDDFHTIRTYTTPIQSHNNKLEIVSDFICSGIAIELTRREQKDKNATKDWKYDDDNFLIATTQNDTFIKQYAGSYPFATNDTALLNVIILEKNPHLNFISSKTLTISNTNDIEFDKKHTIERVDIKDHLSVIWVYTTSIFSPGKSFENATITYDDDIFSERDVAFRSVSGTIEPSTAYNLRSQPVRMLQNWGRWINSGLSYENLNDKLRFTKGVGNITLASKLKSSDTNNRGDITYLLLSEGADLALSDNQSFNRFFYPEKATFKLRLDYNKLYYLKRAFEAKSGDSNNNGYITIRDYTKRKVQLWVTSITYNPLYEMAEITGLVKLRSARPTDENPDPPTYLGSFNGDFNNDFDIE